VGYIIDSAGFPVEYIILTEDRFYIPWPMLAYGSVITFHESTTTLGLDIISII